MKFNIGDIVSFEPEANNPNAEWFLGKIVARRHSNSQSLPHYEQYGIEQIDEANKPKLVNNSVGGRMLVFCQADLDRLNNDVLHDYEFANDVVGKSFYTWAFEDDMTAESSVPFYAGTAAKIVFPTAQQVTYHIRGQQDITVINAPIEYISITMTVGDIDEEDCCSLRDL